MLNLSIQLSKYFLVILITVYTVQCFAAVASKTKLHRENIYQYQRAILFTIHFLCHMILFLETRELRVLVYYALEVVLLGAAIILYQNLYRSLSKLILNNMLMLISIGFIMQARLNLNYAKRQLIIVGGALGICLVIPVIIDKMKVLSRFGWLYAAGGLGILGLVFVCGVTHYGATNWAKIAGIEFQPSEVAKIVFVFCVASLLAKVHDFRRVVLVSLVAGAHVLLLVYEKDLGAALIFFVTYICILYAATANPLYPLAGTAAGAAASVVAYKVFSHVRVRVTAWRDPWSVIDNEGYQVANSLLAIGTGGWFGMGLGKGMPTSIPVVNSDFIFAAISEELGALFAICLILISLSNFLMFINIAMRLRHKFYKLTALGLSVNYMFQVFLTIGGATKFIPSTGVTFPLVSYGGSSIISTVIVFAVIQGLYVLHQDEEEQIRRAEAEEEQRAAQLPPGAGGDAGKQERRRTLEQ
ncbi:MAG: FtsW/RodA/SpoVE family cell cycle protein [Lachnospiraceae bacterium]|nr:FtsW/RodA/SpoVE family cell cycle protein [Lachnospiraceae bacterium]